MNCIFNINKFKFSRGCPHSIPPSSTLPLWAPSIIRLSIIPDITYEIGKCKL